MALKKRFFVVLDAEELDLMTLPQAVKVAEGFMIEHHQQLVFIGELTSKVTFTTNPVKVSQPKDGDIEKHHKNEF